MLELRELRPLQALAASVLFRERRLLLSLPRQYGGKTELGVRIAHDLLRRPFTKSALFLAKDKRSGKKATREKYERLFDRRLFDVNTDLVKLKACPPGVQSIQFMDSVDKDPDRIRGGTYSYVHWSEVAFSKIEKGESIMTVFDKIVKPTTELTNGYCLLESTNNGKNGWWELWNAAEQFRFAKLKVSLADMVYMGLVSRERYDKIQRETHPDVFRQEYECDWVTFQGKVYAEFDPDDHVMEDMPGPEEWMTVASAIDWGYHPSATCVLFAYVKGGVLHVFDELYATQELAAVTAQMIEAKRDQWRIRMLAAVADHEADRVEELTRRNIACGLASKADILGARIQIKELFYFNKIKISPRCKFLLRDLQAAVWDEKKAIKGEIDYTQCTWGHFDAEAALRYLVRELSEMESTEPTVNPHASADPLSAAAFDIRMRAQDGANSW
jgi:hypothetical protein